MERYRVIIQLTVVYMLLSCMYCVGVSCQVNQCWSRHSDSAWSFLLLWLTFFRYGKAHTDNLKITVYLQSYPHFYIFPILEICTCRHLNSVPNTLIAGLLFSICSYRAWLQHDQYFLPYKEEYWFLIPLFNVTKKKTGSVLSRVLVKVSFFILYQGVIF